jgi:hypothetical protein
VNSITGREFKGKGGALANLTYYIDTTFVPFYNAVNHRQPKTQALTFTFGSKKGFKYMRQIFFTDATACVSHADEHTAVTGTMGCCHRKFPPLGHGVDGIEDEVYDALLNLIVVTSNFRQSFL